MNAAKFSSITLTVISTVLNDPNGLLATGISVLSQDYPIEWLVKDAGREGESGQIAMQLSKNYPMHRVTVINSSDSSLYEGMNQAYEASTGKIILFLNAQDVLVDSGVIRRIVQSYEENNWSWAVALAVRLDQEGEPDSVWSYLKPSLTGLALGLDTFCHQSTFYTREILEKTMPYELDNLAADHHLNIKCFKIDQPEIIPWVTTLFQNGGSSSQISVKQHHTNLKKIRSDENLLIFNSKFVDGSVVKILYLSPLFGSLAYGYAIRVIRVLAKYIGRRRLKRIFSRS